MPLAMPARKDSGRALGAGSGQHQHSVQAPLLAEAAWQRTTQMPRARQQRQRQLQPH